MSKRGILILLGVFVVAFALLGVGKCGYGKIESLQSLEKAAAYTREKYPKANPVSVKTLQMYQRGGIPLVLVDIRSQNEFEVSRIPGALHFAKGKGLAEHILSLSVKPDQIVIYDSLGFRSAKFTDSLSANEVPGAVHLEGGVFEWANRGLPLIDAEGKPAKKVHPYNKTWGRLLKEELRMSLEETN